MEQLLEQIPPATAGTGPELPWHADPLWYRDAVIYQLHVKAFFDANDDGVGDFRGLIRKLDYIQDLGVNAIWLLPFYPSPLRDDGYDIADYRNVHPDYGRRGDLRRFVREAHRRGLKIITELVINHTSDQHPWFQAARRARPGSGRRDFYVWSDTDTRYAGTRIIFTDTETSNWAWDPVARAYYWHRFFSHQPDLNFDNPRVLEALMRVMYFWLDMGVDGMRLDAIPYLVEREGTNNENLPETHAVIKRIRAMLDARYSNRMFLAEANQWPEDVRDYFGDGDECHMAYHFPLMPRMYMAIAQEDRHPIVDIMRQTPDIPAGCQWAIFLRNHDELTLEMVTDAERDYMYQTYAADPRARLNLGIRRRLAPLMDNDPDKIKLMNSLLFSMPGSPIIYYGDEIGMGDNFFLGDRNGVRTPMQWSPDRNAGFSRADPQRLYLPPIMDPVYGYEAVNVEAQSRDPSSLLNWMKRILAVRKSCQAFGRGTLEFLRPGNRKILAYVREHGGTAILCVANLARTAQPVELDLSRFRGHVPVELMGRTAFPPVGELPYLLTVPGYGFYWFHLAPEAEVPRWHEDWLPPAELPVLVLFEGWGETLPTELAGSRRELAERLRGQLEREVLEHWLPAQRWFGAKGRRIDKVEIGRLHAWQRDAEPWWLTLITVHLDRGDTHTYFVPLAIAWEDGDEERLRMARPATLAKVRLRARVGWLFDAFADAGFCRALVQAIGEGAQLAVDGRTLHCQPTSRFAEFAAGAALANLRQPGAQGTNTTVILDDRLFVKIYRRLCSGPNVELEMGRFLTERSPYPNVVPLAGSIEIDGVDGGTASAAMVQAYVKNQGDGWTYTLDYLQRFLDESRLHPIEEVLARARAMHEPYLVLMRTLGQRTGELHKALSAATGEAAFDPEPVSSTDLRDWTERVLGETAHTLDRLQTARANLSEAQQQAAAALLRRRRGLLGRVRRLAPARIEASRIRYHGDLHLGQVLVAENDFLIIDFEGEPARPVSARRAKSSPLRDVAGMLRSFSYAGAVALEHVTADRPQDRERLAPLAADWEAASAAGFLDGYQTGVAGAACQPRRAEHTRRLIELFTVEKACYELRYELDNRPDWVGVPLAGLLALAGAGAA